VRTAFLKEPGGHMVQPVRPPLAANWPSGQAVHTAWPCEPCTVSYGAGLHEMAGGVRRKAALTSEQLLQTLMPRELWKRPTGHNRHDELPLTARVRAGA
jgi:hypothetical protein